MTSKAAKTIGNRAYWLALGAVVLAILANKFLSGTSAGLDPTTIWDNAAIASIPTWLRVWLMGVVAPVFLISVLFAWTHTAARWVFAGFVLSHIPIIGDFGPISVGMVGWIHLVCWSPALIALALERGQLPIRSFYGAWVNVAVAVISISLVFDAISAIALLFA